MSMKILHNRVTVLGILLLVLLAAPTFAQDEEPAEHTEDAVETATEAAEHGEKGTHDENAYEPNEISGFVGLTDEKGHDPEFTLGLDYERRLSLHWGVGGLIDYAGGDLRNTLFAVPVFWHPTRDWKIIAAPGIEFHSGRGSTAHGEGGTGKSEGSQGEADEDETYFLFRLGTTYHFHLTENWDVAPALFIDFVNGERVWVYGLGFSREW